MKTIVYCLIVCCAGAFFACEQSIVNPPPIPPAGTLAAADYMLSVKPGDSETFNQTTYDSIGRVISPTVTITMMVLDVNVPLVNGKNAVEVAYTQRDAGQPYEIDYITSSDSGIISYSDTMCKNFKNILLNPLRETAWFGLPYDYTTIDSLNTSVTTDTGTFRVLKMTECEVNYVTHNGSGDLHKDSTVTELYMKPGALVVYQRVTDIQKKAASDEVESKTITVTSLRSKTW